ncbi:GNAT family N-acetyltransferase [Candidatus Entotheonella palauensis]|uniref:GNAT family N-acetyltransferase n=1 Tax=Candidatus Entotheonella palauensis TaxID=93172 RepID=UPI000B7DC0D8|nr:GNAT family N-acetyltransferase [Candidatus Entotheonella palauensis]
MIRQLALADFEDAYRILLDVAAWLRIKGIKQWETPLPKPVYTTWLSQGLCYGYFVDGRLAAVFTIRTSDLSEWGIPTAHPVNWLSTMAVSRSFAGHRIGGQILSWILSHIEKPLFLDCFDYDDVLPKFYRANDFREVRRKHLHGGPMVLMEAISYIKNRSETSS